jgi:Arc/MetJ-type ribon-helix-helix transcriptional regulator
MKLSFKPELQKFIDEQVRAGHFPSAKDVVEAALLRLMLDPVDEALDDAALAAIERADAEFARGEDRPFGEVAAELRQRFMRK